MFLGHDIYFVKHEAPGEPNMPFLAKKEANKANIDNNSYHISPVD